MMARILFMGIIFMGFASKIGFGFLFMQVCIFVGFIYLDFWKKVIWIVDEFSLSGHEFTSL